jgi:hypothetical protein
MNEFATSQEEFTRQEVKSALRNAGMPLEGLRYPIKLRSGCTST